jgi:hypothetical protein
LCACACDRRLLLHLTHRHYKRSTFISCTSPVCRVFSARDIATVESVISGSCPLPIYRIGFTSPNEWQWTTPNSHALGVLDQRVPMGIMGIKVRPAPPEPYILALHHTLRHHDLQRRPFLARSRQALRQNHVFAPRAKVSLTLACLRLRIL